MASDGPPKRPGTSSGAPRVPPPPKLSFVEEAEEAEEPASEPTSQPASEPTSQPTDAPSPEVEARAALSIDLDLDAAVEFVVPPEPPPPPARRGVLPPPKSDGKRVQPLGTRGQRNSGARKRPSASGLPAGMRAPGVPQETEPENTDILIASAVAALTEGDPAENSFVSLTEVPPAAAATSATALPTPRPSGEPVPKERKRRGFVWFAVAALAGLAVLAIAFSGGDDDEPKEASAASVVTAANKPPLEPEDEAVTAAVSAATPEPDLPPLAVEVPPDLGGAWDELGDAPDVGGEVVAALDVGSAELPPDLVEPVEAGGADEAGADVKRKSARAGNRQRQRQRQRTPKKSTASNARPPPAAPPKQPADAAALLADARKALAAGQARKAYSLAAKSRGAKRTSAALIVMAKAACRFGGESQAKSAFNQLSVGNRRGLRAECRNHGVRLGL